MNQNTIDNPKPMREMDLHKSSKSTFSVMFLTFISRLLGFVRIAVVAAIFGAGGKADVLNAVFTIPNNLRKLMAEGALSSAFIPVLSAANINDPSGTTSKRIVSNLLAFQIVVLVPLCIFSIIFAEPLIKIVLVEFDDPEKITLSVDLFRWFINYILFISVSAVLMGALNSKNSFFIPALTPILFSISVIISILWLHRWLGAFSMAFGVLVGGVLQILFQSRQFKKLNFSFALNFHFSNSQFRAIIKNWLPVVATASIFTINQQIAVRFSTGLSDGSASSLHYALVFFQLPFGIFSASITTVLFPRMSRQVERKDTEGLSESLQYGLRFLLVFLLPSSLFLVLLGKQIISVAMFRGAFSLADTIQTSTVLIGYSIGLYSVGAFNFLQRTFYARGNYKIPFSTALITVIIDVGLSLWLKETYLGVTGLALANSGAFTIGLIVLLILTKHSLGTLHGKIILSTTAKVFISLIPTAAFVCIFLSLTGDWWKQGSSLFSFFMLFSVGIIGIGILILMYLLLKIEMIWHIVKSRR
jgi:putative peptidoglycan lipid II flippase